MVKSVAQIKDIITKLGQMAQIPDEDFPSIMPMRKGVHRVIVSKRKTPLERKLTSQHDRRNLPIVSSHPPINKATMGISGYPLFISIFFLCFSTFIFTSASPDINSSQLATQICKNTTNVSFCMSAIFSDPLASTADRYVLSYIVFGQAYKNATSTKNHIGLSLKSMKTDENPRVVSGMQKCQGFYEDAIRALTEVMNNLDSETFYGLDKAAIDVESSIRACESSFSGQSPMSQKNQDLVELLKICFAVSQLYQYN